MRKSAITCLLMLMIGSAAAFAQTPAKLQQADRTEFPHAGISLVLPKGFELQQPEEPTQVMRAVALVQKQPALSVSLSAYLVDEQTTPEKFATSMLEDLRKSLTVRHLEIRKTTPMKVAKLQGTARLLSYTYGGEKALAASVCFIRPVPSPAVRVCYLLSVEAARKHQARLLPTFGKLVESVLLTAIHRPAKAPIGALGPAIRDSQRGYSFRPPLRWFAIVTDAGVVAGQSDYLRGGLTLPRVQVAVENVTERGTSEACAKRWLKQARLLAESRGLEASVLCEGPAKLAGLEAYEFLLVQSAKSKAAATRPSASQPAGFEEPVIIAQRTVCTGGEGPRKSYSLVLLFPGADQKAAAAMLGRLAEGFALLKRAATQPKK